jgi:hypothetical protein
MMTPELRSSGGLTCVLTDFPVVVRLGTTADGAPSVSFFDAQQKIRLMVGLSANGSPSLSLIDPQQVPRVVLSLNDQLDPSLTIFNAEKLPRAVFSIDGGNTGGSGHLILYGASTSRPSAECAGIPVTALRWTSCRPRSEPTPAQPAPACGYKCLNGDW